MQWLKSLRSDCIISAIDNKVLSLSGKEFMELTSFHSDIDFDFHDKFSLSFWLRTRTRKIAALVAKMPDNLPHRGWDILLADYQSNPALRLQLIHSYPDNWTEAYIDASGILDGNWHHVVVTYSNVNNTPDIRFYLDGKECHTSIISNSLNESIKNHYPITIGARSKGGCEFDGSLYELKTYNSVLKTSKIKKIFSSSEASLNQK